MKKYTLPTLYKKAKNNKISEWDIWIEIDKNNVPIIIRNSGFVNFKHRETKRYIRKGTNIGKSNEKSAYENAIFIVNNYWKDHIEDNYVDSINKIDDEPLFLKPMLAKPLKKNNNDNFKNKIVQPKYNGIRAVSFRHKGDTHIISRERKVIDTVNHIESNLPNIFLNHSPDGELYNHNLTFQEIVRRVKKYREGLTEEIQYWVYDLAIPDIIVSERLNLIDKIIPNNHRIIKKVPYYYIDSYDEFKQYHDKFVSDGYEGIILREPNSFYGFNDRPSCLQKYKEFKDAEYKIVDYNKEEWDDNGVMYNLVVWVCETEKGERFNVRPKGSFQNRIYQYNRADMYIGKMYTVRYQEESENGTPIFGIGIEFRDYE